MEQSQHQTSGNDLHKKLVVGWFSFTCCEDSTILFTELLNDHLDEWKKVIEFRHIKALKTNSRLPLPAPLAFLLISIEVDKLGNGWRVGVAIYSITSPVIVFA